MIMKQRLLKTIGLVLLMVVGASNAWADNDTSKLIYVEGGSSEGYTDLATAIGACTDNTETNIYINGTVTVSSEIKFNTGTGATNTNKRVVLIAGVEGATIKSGTTSRLFLVNSGTASLKLGDGSETLIIDGDNKSYASGFISIDNDYKPETTTNTHFLNNVTIKNVKATGSGGSGYVYQRKNSGYDKIVFKDVTFNNCTVTGTSGTEAIVRYLRAAVLYLDGTINFDTNCKGTSFYIDDRKTALRANSDVGDLTISNPITLELNWSKAYNYDGSNNTLVKFNTTNAGKVSIKNGVLVQKSSTTDWKAWQAYRLSVSSANAATLVLPFESTIPSGATCYTLSYTSGDDITATEVTGGTLAANTPVLVTATGSAEGTEYVFQTTAAENTAFSAGSGTQTSGVLTGVYTKTTVPTSDEDNHYFILAKHEDVVGFYKVTGSTNKVAAYRAYMTVPTSSHGAREFFGIDFDGETTAIDKVDVEKEMTGEVYNLQGVRMQGENLPKGIYVKNGRKFIVK